MIIWAKKFEFSKYIVILIHRPTLTSISASCRYPTVRFVMSNVNGSSREMSPYEGSSGSFPRIASRIIVQSAALQQKVPSLSWTFRFRFHNKIRKTNVPHKVKMIMVIPSFPKCSLHQFNQQHRKLGVMLSHHNEQRIGYGASCFWANCKRNHACDGK